MNFERHDYRGEVLQPIVGLRSSPPSWWDAEATRVKFLTANFRGQSLRSANFSGAYLEQADFSGADLADGTLQGTFLGGANFDRSLLEETDLSGAYLRFATFQQGVLEGANLRGADLWGAKLPEADADKADFREAQLEEAIFQDADAREADFRDSKIGLADFRNADLRMSDFRGCVPRGTKFDGADLRRANLELLDLTNTSLGPRLALRCATGTNPILSGATRRHDRRGSGRRVRVGPTRLLGIGAELRGDRRSTGRKLGLPSATANGEAGNPTQSDRSISSWGMGISRQIGLELHQSQDGRTGLRLRRECCHGYCCRSLWFWSCSRSFMR